MCYPRYRPLSSLSDPNFPRPNKSKASSSVILVKIVVASIVGTVGSIFVSKEARDLISNIDGAKHVLDQIEERIGGFYDINSIFKSNTQGSSDLLTKNARETNTGSSLPNAKQYADLHTTKSDKEKIETESKSLSDPQSLESSPYLKDIESAIKQRAATVLDAEIIFNEDLTKLTSLAENYVENALYELERLGKSSEDFLKKVKAKISTNDASREQINKLHEKLGHNKGDMTKYVSDAKHQLHILEEAVRKARKNPDCVESKILGEALDRHKDLQYQLDTAVLKAIESEAEIDSVMRRDKSQLAAWKKVEDKMNTILENSSSTRNKDSQDQSREYRELNALLIRSYEQIEALENHLKQARQAQWDEIDSEIKYQKKQHQRLLEDAVTMELAKQKDEFAIERIKWDEETKALVEKELKLALARHSDHLAHIVKLKQEEMEHSLKQRLREGVITERSHLEKSIRGWTKRMEAIDHVVQGRAELDRISKQAQALWLAVEALASAIEFPTASKSSSDTSQIAATTGPLSAIFTAIEEASPAGSTFLSNLLTKVPETALVDGIYTTSSLKERFKKVHRVCRQVAYIDDTNTSLGRYISSCLQSALTFDLGRRFKLFSRSNAGIDRNMDMVQVMHLIEENQFNVLDNARAAVERGDFEFALKLMLCLRGQARALAHDWCEDVRAYLEISMVSQALLAHASATGITSFQERL